MTAIDVIILLNILIIYAGLFYVLKKFDNYKKKKGKTYGIDESEVIDIWRTKETHKKHTL